MGRVWLDENKNQVEDQEETGVAAIPFNILSQPSDEVVGTGVTDADGRFRIEGLAPGEYLLDLDQFSLWTDDYLLTTGNEPQAIILATCREMTATSIGFGPKSTNSSFVAGRVWDDTNRDGVRDPEERLLADIEIELLNALGAPLSATVSDSSGLFGFVDLTAGNYYLQANAFLAEVTSQSVNSMVLVQVDEGQSLLTANLALASTGAIEGTIYRDGNGNGAWEPGIEQGVFNVPISAEGLSTGVIVNVFSDTQGRYLLVGLQPGVYRLSAPDQFGGASRTSPSPTQVTILNNEMITNNNFGYISPTSVDVASFAAQMTNDGADIAWITSRET